LLALNRDYDAPRESFEELHQEINAERLALQRQSVAALSELDLHVERVLEIRASFYEVAARYDSTPEELSNALGQCVAEAERVQKTLLNARFQLREATKRREWKEICEGLEVRE
jgi:hypothetical protein